MNSHWKDIRHVVFDWNGTLIDDLALAVQSVNHVRSLAGLEPITSNEYRARFRFPIEAFYAAIGFDFQKTPYSSVVKEYLSVFDAQVKYCSLHSGAEQLLSQLYLRGIGASILSASHRTVLTETIRAKGLSKYFMHITGLEDGYAVSKLQAALKMSKELDVKPHQVLYVGDTDHDAEIAQTLGWQARMLLCGHQDDIQLQKFPYPCLPDLSALLASLISAESNRAGSACTARRRNDICT